MMLTDEAGRIEYIDSGFGHVTGYREQEVVCRTPRLLRSGPHESAFYAALWATLRLGRVFRAVFANRHAVGSVFYEDKAISPLRDKDGTLTHFVSTGRDVTQSMMTRQLLRETRLQLQEAHRSNREETAAHRLDLVRLRQDLEEARDVRRRFLAGVSHELMRPIESILRISGMDVQCSAAMPARVRLSFEMLRARFHRVAVKAAGHRDDPLLGVGDAGVVGVVLRQGVGVPVDVVGGAARAAVRLGLAVHLHVGAGLEVGAHRSPSHLVIPSAARPPMR